MVIQKNFVSKVIIKFLVLLCFARLPDVNAKLEFVKKSYEFPGKNVRFNDHSIEKENVVFAICEGQNEEKNCTIVHQSYPYDEIRRICNLTVNLAKDISNMRFVFMDVRPLGNDKALLIWETEEKNSSTNYVKITTLNMNDCGVSEFQLRDSSSGELYWSLHWYDIIVRYNESYDIFLKTENPYGNAIRKLRVDSQTGLIEELNSYLNHKPIKIFAVATESPAKGYVYRENCESLSDNKTIILKYWLLKPDGSQKLLQSFGGGPRTHLITSGNNAIGICGISGNASNIQCTQYDENGNVKSTTILEDSIARAKSMYMTPDGGFLLLLVDYKNNRYVNYRVLRVDKKGKIVGKLRFSEFDTNLITPRIFDKGDENYCISFLSRDCESFYDDECPIDMLNIVAYCFTEDDLFMNFKDMEIVNRFETNVQL